MRKQIIALSLVVVIAGLLVISVSAEQNSVATASDLDRVLALAAWDGASCAGIDESGFGNGDFLGTAASPAIACCGGDSETAEEAVVVAAVATEGAACAGVSLDGADESYTMSTAGEEGYTCCGSSSVTAAGAEQVCEDDSCVSYESCTTGPASSY